MTTTSFGTWTGQPPVTPGSGIVSSDWVPGPSDGIQSSVVVSFTDFQSESEEDWQQIAVLGMRLGESWPIMRGAVGLWLWGKQTELRGGSVSVWESHTDLRRFIRWPAHVAIMNNWRARVRVRTAGWDDATFVPAQAWLRAEERIRAPRDM